MFPNLITFVYYCHNYLKMNCTLCLIKIHHYNKIVLRALTVSPSSSTGREEMYATGKWSDRRTYKSDVCISVHVH
jgi:hypothetical protein